MAGDVVAVDGPLPGAADTTTYGYDGARRLGLVVSADPDGAGPLRPRVRSVLGADGPVLVETGSSEAGGANFAASSAYDPYGRRMGETLSAGGVAYPTGSTTPVREGNASASSAVGYDDRGRRISRGGATRRR